MKNLSTDKPLLILGGIAYDHIMGYDHNLKQAFTQADLSHISVSFTATSKRFNFGGCGGNIAYTLNLLGGSPYLFTTAGGQDSKTYIERLKKLNIETDGIKIDPDEYTASCYILTDPVQSQITFFHPGAQASFLHELQVKDLTLENYGFALITPDHPHRMTYLALQLKEQNFPYFFDPSQQLASIKKEELKQAIEGCQLLFVNEYESLLISELMNTTKQKLIESLPSFVETRGENGSAFAINGKITELPAIKPKLILDPTGCGDAYRAGVIYGISKGYTLEKSCKIGALCATYNIEFFGTQNHTFTPTQFATRYQESWNETL